MSTEAREARAEAKAAEARAKALRPWYRKKRTWLGGVVALIVIISIAASAGGKKSSPSATAASAASAPAGSTTGVSTASSNTDFPPPADVTVASCTGPDAIGAISVAGTILNHSPKTSNYLVQGTLVDASGAHVGDWATSENNIAAGQTARFSTEGIPSNPQGGVTCKVSTVDRYASAG